MPGRDPYPQLLGGGGPILRPRPLDGRPALAAPAVPGVVESGPPMQSRSSTWANIKWFPRGVEAAGVPPAAVPPPLSTSCHYGRDPSRAKAACVRRTR